jgi:sec-independent protein translocase protein TatA
MTGDLERLSCGLMVGDILQPTHLLFILIVALLVLGPKRLPEVGRSLGRGLRDFRSAISGEESPEAPIPPTTSQTPAQPVQPAQPIEPPQPAQPAQPTEAAAPAPHPSDSTEPVATGGSEADPQPVGTTPTEPAQ